MSVEMFRYAYVNLLNQIEMMLENSKKQLLSILDEQIIQGSTALILSYNNRTETIASVLRFKFDRILVPVREPMLSGRGMVLRLRRHKVNAYYIPDESLAWAVDQADVIISDAIGSLAGGRLLVDAGVEAALSLAINRNTTPLIVLSIPASCEVESDIIESLPYFIVKSSENSPQIKLNLIDIIDPKELPFKIVTENDAVRATRKIVRDRQRHVRELVEDKVRFILSS
jgi:translation initiation factor 2B subunit (eIF-2B alpha/beta/delta family)